jgi:two-component system, NtrC family, sensor histidine kinase KinB
MLPVAVQPTPTLVREELSMDPPVTGDELSRTAAVMESLAIGAILLDQRSRVVHVNELAAIIMGIDPPRLIGQLFTELECKNPHYLQICEAVNRIKEYPTDEQQAEVALHVRGREHNYLLRQSALHASDGELLGLLILFHDLTHLRDKERARTNLIASLSHELNTPLTALSLAVGLLKRNARDENQREIVDTLSEEVSRIRDLSDGLVSAVRGETASIAVRSINLELGGMAASVAKRFLLSAGQKAIRLKIHTDDGLLCYGDPIKLAWVLTTLIKNALACTPEGGEINVCALREASRLRLRVSDTGPGMAPDLADTIFERGVQWLPENSASGAEALGLEIAKEIVEAHGGRIFAEGSARGNVFTVDLPLA